MVTKLKHIMYNTNAGYSKVGLVWRQSPSPLHQTRQVPSSLQRPNKAHFDLRKAIVVRPKKANIDPRLGAGEPDEESEAEDVIDLGAPRPPRQRRAAPPRRRRALTTYTPNPRLYPGFTQKKRRLRGEERTARRRHKRVLRRVVPNSRLYRPAPPRARAPPPPPPRAAPRAAWPAPAPARALDTASRAALRLAERRALLAPQPPQPPRRPALLSPYPRRARFHHPPSPSRAPSIRCFYDIVAAEARSALPLPGEPRRPRRPHAPGPAPAPAHRLVVTLPEGAMTSSASDEPTDSADAASAPSEYLAEFLSAIMRQQYAEALKYCRLILHFEPHNATARGFHPLLQHKLRLQRHLPGAVVAKDTEVAAGGRSGCDEAGAAGGAGGAGGALLDLDADPYSPQEMEQEADESPSASLYSPGSASDGDGDESDRSLSLYRSRSDRTDRTDGTDGTDPLRSSSGSPATSAGSAVSAGSARSAASARSADLNGNCAALAPPRRADDVKNDNAPGDHIYFNLNSESSASLSSLQRLRARFACSK